jgi:phosphatidate cytidylyltransferase
MFKLYSYLIVNICMIIWFFTIAIYKTSNTIHISNDHYKKYISLLIISNIFISILLYGNNLKILIFLIIIILGFLELSKYFKTLNASNKSFLYTYIVCYTFISFFFAVFSLLEQQLIILTYLIVFCFDGFSQITGMLYGRKMILRRISPNKTVEGTIGGILFTNFLWLIIFSVSEDNHSLLSILAMINAICFLAFLGDAFASIFKRKCNIKDFNNLIPGHGGILDRFDSFMFSGGIIGLYKIITLITT